MKAKDKAEELVSKYYFLANSLFNQKQCALIVVDEILLNCYEVLKPFWEEVKQEIENYERTK